jgi:hypothetical protein
MPRTSVVLISCCRGEGCVALLGLNAWIDGGSDLGRWLSLIMGSM